MGSPTQHDWAGIDLVVNKLRVGATTPGTTGTELSGTEIAVLDGVTAGTVTASKALVVDTNKDLATLRHLTISGNLITGTTTLSEAELGVLDSASAANSGTSKAMITGTSGAVTVAGAATFSVTPILATGTTLDVASGTATLVSNAATITEYAAQITSEALTTAAGASQAFVITKTGVAATDLVFVTPAGGTNTRKNYNLEAVATTNTVTVTLYNTEPTNAINGTVIFNLWVIKP